MNQPKISAAVLGFLFVFLIFDDTGLFFFFIWIPMFYYYILDDACRITTFSRLSSAGSSFRLITSTFHHISDFLRSRPSQNFSWSLSRGITVTLWAIFDLQPRLRVHASQFSQLLFQQLRPHSSRTKNVSNKSTKPRPNTLNVVTSHQ